MQQVQINLEVEVVYKVRRRLAEEDWLSGEFILCFSQ
jgi:hypothetical protein